MANLDNKLTITFVNPITIKGPCASKFVFILLKIKEKKKENIDGVHEIHRTT